MSLEVPSRDDPLFSPLWLNLDISEPDKLRVQEWLGDNGVDVNKCAGFDYYENVKMIRARMYRINIHGMPDLDENGEPIWDDPIEFSAEDAPPIVTSCHSLHRQY